MMSPNVNNQFGPFEDLFKEVRMQAKKKSRRYIAIFVVICLAFGLIGFLCGRASAAAGDTKTFNNDTFDSPNWRTLYSYVHEFLEEHSEDGFEFMVLGQVTNQYNQRYNSWSITISQWPIKNMGGQMEVYLSEQGNALGVRGFWIDNNGSVSNVVYNSVGSTQYGYRYYPTSYPNIGSYSYGWFWSSHENDICPANLIVPEFLPPPDPRTFSVTKKYDNGNYWLYCEVEPYNFNYFYITFEYQDSLGTFSKTIGRDDIVRFEDIADPPYYAAGFWINPNDISQYKFTLKGAEIFTNGEYGDKSVELDLIFNEDPFPLPTGYGDVTSYSEYNVFRNPGIIGANRDVLHIGYIDGNSSLLSWYDSYGTCMQPFRLRWIALPDFMWDWPQSGVGDWALEEFYQLFEQYDVVILGVSPTIFNKLYPYNDALMANWTSNYTWLAGDYAIYGADDVIAKIMGLQSDYLSLDKVHSDSAFTESDYETVGFVWTRTLLLKQVSYFCGDTSERLLEFERRLVDTDDGVLTMIQNKLVDMYVQDNQYYNSVLSGLGNISYALNGLDFGVLDSISIKLDRIIGYLDFDLNIDISKLSHPWVDIYSFAKNMFDDSEPMWASLGYAGEALYDGLEVTPQYDVNQLPQITGGIPLFPTIGPDVPLIPTLTPTPIPIGG